ncbi:MAG TPA: hypothetical protein VN017_02510 [Pseudoxanthomonas sp.]|nr:hypothetical protein [Pseudoxanthomonas sp.]
MKLSSVAKLISGSLSAEDYSSEISVELAEHTRRLGHGRSASVRVTEDIDFVLDRAGLGQFCRLFASGQLTERELAYTADALQLAERVEFSCPDIADDLDCCTDPEINGPLATEQALEIAGRGAAT